jgi:sugar phosphate isomerase/epimerase
VATPPDEAAKSAIWELLQEAARLGVGVAFEPEREGWQIHYIDLDDWPA